MLYVGIKKPNGETDSRTWHIGGISLSHTVARNETVEYVQADGDELALIYRELHNIPQASTRVVKWRGDFARFIVDNL